MPNGVDVSYVLDSFELFFPISLITLIVQKKNQRSEILSSIDNSLWGESILVNNFLCSKLGQQNSTVSLCTSCVERFWGRSIFTLKIKMSHYSSQIIATVPSSDTLSRCQKHHQLVLNMLSKWYFIFGERSFGIEWLELMYQIYVFLYGPFLGPRFLHFG